MNFGWRWTYQSEAWARRFFENWKQALKWQRLKPYEKFARMIDAHWGGIAACCQPRNKVPLGFVEGLNNKIRVLQRRAYGRGRFTHHGLPQSASGLYLLMVFSVSVFRT